MNALYNTAIRLYSLAARIAARRSPKVAKMIEGQERSIAAVRSALGDGGCDLWVHAASLGEFEQGRPLIERYRKDHPDAKILLTFFSPSGYEVRKNYDKVDAVAYLPFDIPGKVSEFLDAARPRCVVFVKYEFWGNYLSQIKERNIPLYIISAVFRAGQPFFSWWGGELRGLLKRFDRIYVQDEDSASLVRPVNPEVVVAGDTRFDRVTDVMKTTFSIPAVEEFAAGDVPVLIAGSSWEADEACYIPWYLRHRGEVKMIIAPHEFDDRRLEKLISSFADGEAALLSRFETMDADARRKVRVVIVDSFGKLSSLYRYGDIAYIGGGFGTGIHNINEAAVYGMPVVFGPKNGKFIEAREMAECGGGFPVDSAEAVDRTLTRLITDRALLADASEKAGKYIRSKVGATDIIYNDLFLNKNHTPND